ncbi:segregation and condensation protein A [Feifania hominis]|uniref:segregation and condensation protein A n=1 Tax=Feifania hominis TaxID=2763660 RepID=UPI0020166F9A|nr:segregation/condensation protein A [Feifania hominis]
MWRLEKISYKFEVFEGPLDLLLHLIDKNKLNICDIPIADLLEQYMEYVNAYQQMDLDNVSEFMVIASDLLYIKSKMLLPKSEEEMEEDPRESLVNLLLDYKKYKEISLQLAESREKIGLRTLVREPTPITFDNTYHKHHDIGELLAAYKNVARKSARRIPPTIRSFSGIVSTHVVSVFSRVLYVLRTLKKKSRVAYRSLFASDDSRSERVATFLALLELIKSKRICVEGEEEKLEVILTQGGETNGQV